LAKIDSISDHFFDNDPQFLQRLKADDLTAFAEVYNSYYIPLLELAARKTGDFQQAEEIVQDAFVSMYFQRSKIREQPTAYLRAIIKYKIIDLRRKKSLQLVSLTDSDPVENSSDPYRVLFEAELQAQVDHYVDQLPAQCKKVFILSRQHGLSNKEIAGQLEISIRTVETHISRALKYLRANMDYHLVWWLAILATLKHL